MSTERPIGEVERELARRFPELRIDCGTCHGTGSITECMAGSKTQRCPVCDGQRYFPKDTDRLLGIIDARGWDWEVATSSKMAHATVRPRHRWYAASAPTSREALCRALLAAAEGESP